MVYHATRTECSSSNIEETARNFSFCCVLKTILNLVLKLSKARLFLLPRVRPWLGLVMWYPNSSCQETRQTQKMCLILIFVPIRRSVEGKRSQFHHSVARYPYSFLNVPKRTKNANSNNADSASFGKIMKNVPLYRIMPKTVLALSLKA